MKKIVMSFLIIAMVAATSISCREKKSTGEKIEDAVEETGEEIEEGAEEVKDEIEDATDDN